MRWRSVLNRFRRWERVFRSGRVVLLLIGIAARLPIASAQYVWIQHAPTFVEDLYGVAFPTPSHGFVCGTRLLLMETFDGGQTWRFRSGVGVLTPSVDPFYAVHFYDTQNGWVIGNNNYAFRTTDGGLTWSRMLSVPAGSWSHIDFLSPTTGFIGANGGCAFTSDGGQTWQLRSGYPTCPVMYGMDFRDVNVGLVAGDQISGGGTGIYRTADGGRTWSKRLSGTFNDVIFLDSNTALAAHSDGSIYRSTDAGNSWVQIAPARTNGLGDLARVDNTTVVGVSVLGDIWRSADGGFNWTRVLEARGTLPGIWNAYFRDPQHGWVVGPKGTLLASDDGGHTWRFVSNGVADNITDIKMVSSTFGYAVTRNAYVLRTTDGGRRWDVRHLQVTGNTFGHPEGLLAIDVVDDQFAVAAGIGGIVFKTEDGGATWQPIGYPTLPGSFDINDVRFTSRQTGWVVGVDNDLGHYRNIYRTTDGGQTWQLVVPVQAAVSYHAVDFVGNSGWIVGPRSYLLRTTDGGQTWQQVNLPYGNVTNLQFVDVGFATEQVGWMIGTLGYVLRTTNGGQSWQLQNLGTDEDIAALYVVSENEAWIAGALGSVFHTTNGGQTWVRENTGYPSSLGLSALHGTPDGHLVGGGYQGFLIVRHQGALGRASSFSVPFGRIFSGNLSGIQNSDDTYLILESRAPAQAGNPYAQLVVEGTVTLPNPGPLYFRFEGRTNASPTIAVKQVMELFNFATNQWEWREERLSDNSLDSGWETVVQDASPYIQPGTGRVRARISWYKVGDLIMEPWVMWVDYVQWSVLPALITGDVDGNGCVDDADLLRVLFAFGQTGSGMPEDVNRDNTVDDADLLIVLFNFGSGC
ncbi:Ycf48-like protein [bacterium HR15]|nr:Ycf48-like protein [bacterium HR15]